MRSDARFRRALAVLVGALVVGCGVFVLLGYLQGPKLSGAQVDVTAVIAQPGQQLRLFVNQPIGEIDESAVTISPAVEHTVSADGELIAVQFDEQLAYGTEYTVRIDGVPALGTGRPSTIEHRFTTSVPELHYLDRGAEGDQIVATDLDSTERRVVHTGENVQDFALLDQAIAIVSLAGERESVVDIVSTADTGTQRLRLPEAGAITDLDAASTGTLFGFTLTATADDPVGVPSQVLHIADLTASDAAVPVLGLDGQPLGVRAWEFVPGGTSLVALTRDNSLVLVDTAVPGSILPLGQFTDFDTLSADGTSVTVHDAMGTLSAPLDGAEPERLVPSLLDGDVPFLGQTQVLPGGDRIEQLAIFAADGGRFTSVIARDDGAEAVELYRTPGEGGSIESFRASPNGQYVAIEVIPDVAASESDEYSIDPRSTSVTTVIVDALSGAVIRSVEGFSLEW